MRVPLSPHEAYRRVDFDARVAGADPHQLVSMCYEQLAAALGTALFAHDRGDNQLKGQSLTRALSAIAALQLGVSGEENIARALRHLYKAARKSVLDSAVKFDPAVIQSIRQDFLDISHALNTGT